MRAHMEGRHTTHTLTNPLHKTHSAVTLGTQVAWHPELQPGTNTRLAKCSTAGEDAPGSGARRAHRAHYHIYHIYTPMGYPTWSILVPTRYFGSNAVVVQTVTPHMSQARAIARDVGVNPAEMTFIKRQGQDTTIVLPFEHQADARVAMQLVEQKHRRGRREQRRQAYIARPARC